MADAQVNLHPVREHLERQLASVDHLLANLEEQERAIRAQDVPSVMAATTAMQGEMIRRTRLEQEREVLLTGLAMRLGLRPDQVTSRVLADADPDGIGSEVSRLSEQLRDRVNRLRRRHDHVQELLKSELAFVSHLLSALNPTEKPAEAYGRDGQRPAEPARRSSLNLQG